MRLAWRAFIRQALRSRLFWLWPAMAVLAAAVGWGMLLHRLERDRLEAENLALREASALARGYAARLATSLVAIDQILLHVRFEWKQTGGRLRLEQLNQEGLFPPTELFNVGIADERGFVRTSNVPLPETTSVADRNYFRMQMWSMSDSLYIGEPTAGKVSSRSVIHFSRRLTHGDGNFAGVVRASVAPDYLAANYDNTVLGDHGLMAVIGNDDVVRVARIGPYVHLWNERILRDIPAFGEETGEMALTGAKWFADGRSRYVGWQQVENFPVIAFIGLDAEDAMAPYARAREKDIAFAQRNSALLALFTLIAMGLSARLAWRHHQVELTRTAYRLATEEGNEGFYICEPITDHTGQVSDFMLLDCNENGARLLASSKEALLHHPVSAIVAPHVRDLIHDRLRRAMEHGVVEEDFELSFRPPLPSRWFHLRIAPSESVLAVTMLDVTESRQHMMALERKGNEDALTALPNRHWLNTYLPHAIARAVERRSGLALLFIDLDGFKAVNDTAGHEVGDELLGHAARRLTLAVRPADHVVRLGGDEFIVVIEDIQGRPDAAHVARRVLQAFSESFRLSRGVFSVGTSIGISVYPDDGQDAATLLQHADIAMYSVKATGKRNFRFFDRSFHETVRRRHEWEAELRHALDGDQFVVYYQPRVDIDTGATCSMEALVRWAHPERGIIEPNEFIPLAEETGLVTRLGAIVIDKVCAQLAYWAKSDAPLVPVSINVSPRQFLDVNLPEVLAAALARHRIDPRLVEIELTESSMREDPEKLAATLSTMQKMGLTLLVDDFGTGYSSLAQLQELDFDVLKVDRAFTARLATSREGEVFFTAIITMAHALGMRVVAEGVETLEQIRMLKSLRCDEIQGFYISKPMPPDETQPVGPTWYLPSTSGG